MSLRAIMLGLLLIPVNCYWTTIAEVGFNIGDCSTLPLFAFPIATIFIVALLTQILLKAARKHALSMGELLTVYIMITVGSSVAAESIAEGMFGSIVHPIRYATPENEWRELFLHYLPGWLTISDTATVDHFYRGGSTLYGTQHIKDWAIPLLTWGSLIFALIFIMLCANVIFRKRWCENEKLAFPTIQLPLAMVSEGGSRLIRNKVMWIGFGIAAFIDVLNGCNYLWPSVPRIPVRDLTIHQYFTSKSWSSIGAMRITPYPFAIGLAFFLPLDLSFSCWFFFLLSRLANIIGGAVGWRTLPRFPYFDEQGSGAWIGLCIIALWVSRDHLKQVLKRVIKRSAGIDDSQEPIEYRTAVLGIILASASVILFAFKAGMSVWVAVLFFGIYFALAIGITRMRAELGATHEIYYVNPRRILVRAMGTQVLGASSLTIMSYFYSFNRGYASHPMANHMEALKMGEVASLRGRKLFHIVALVVFLGIISSFWSNLDIIYRYGAEAGLIGSKEFIGRESFQPLQNWLTNPVPPDVPGIGFMGFGFILTVVLMLMRMRFLWWPFHPAGYALAVSYAMDYFWFPFLISWVVKAVILKYGGIKTHRQAIPFFLGLILGDYFTGSLWTIIGIVLHQEVYQIFI